ncbi:MAG: aryldialkylphosphatase [Proteobacteria bacterium]|nr:aryldialkylphosphatase [Pseudomonadota bacterium]
MQAKTRATETRRRLTRAELAGKAQTVTGLVDPFGLGATLMHEHVLWDLRKPDARARNDLGPEITLKDVWPLTYGESYSPRNARFDDVVLAIEEVGLMREAGGRTIVELTCGGIRPDPKGLAEISIGTGVNIVMGCGYYVEEYQDPSNHERSVEDFADEMAAQVLEGAWGTDIRAGMIGEIGCQTPWTKLERRVMEAAVLAQAETGAAINVHPGRHPDQPQEGADFIIFHGGQIERVVISHIDRTIFDEDRLLRLADTGCVLEFDLFGRETSYYTAADIDMPNDAMRLKHIRTLIDHGHQARVVISQDICSQNRLANFGGHGYGHIFRNVLPLMRRRGFSEAEIQAILVDNPRRLLTFV